MTRPATDSIMPRSLHPRSSVRSRLRGALTSSAHACLFVGALLAVLSFFDGPAWLLAVSGFPIGVGFVFGDLKGARRGSLTPITVFAFASALTALANATGLLTEHTPLRSQYFTYAADSYLLLASQLALVGAIMTILGFKAASRAGITRAVFTVLPRVHGGLPDRLLLIGGPIIALAAIALHARLRAGFVGSIMSTVYLLPHIVSFLLARAGTGRRVRGALATALAIATIEGIRALFMAYLRTDIVSPFIALVLGALLGARSLAPLRSRLFVPIYVFAAVFIIYFGAFAQARTTSVGVERLQQVAQDAPAAPYGTTAKSGFWARLTNFNQLSQVGRIATEDGFLQGQTLQYLGFVFVPRFLWPGKPIIQKGGWFAWRIGQAWIRPDGRYTNAVNMTVPGELYLNYGWFGVVVGCALFGAFVALLWSRTAFWSPHSGAVGAAFGYYLFWTSLTLAADLQTIVTLLATYCIFVAIGLAVRVLLNRTDLQRRGPLLSWQHRYSPRVTETSAV